MRRQAYLGLLVLAASLPSEAGTDVLDRAAFIRRYGLDRIELPRAIDFVTKRTVLPITTQRLRLEVNQQKGWAAGVLKWRVADVRDGKPVYLEGQAAPATSYLSKWKSDPASLTKWGQPTSRMDRRFGHVHWYPHRGTTEWIDYAFAKPVTVRAVEIYWFDDSGGGNCRLPESWRLLAHDGKEWTPVDVLRPAEKTKKQKPDLAAWFEQNIPFFECPDKAIEEVYYFRWGVFRRHIKHTLDGWVVTEFLPPVPWAGKHNTISCPAGHHFREGRWLHDPRYLDDYAVFWLRKGGSPRSYSFWIADSVWHRHLVVPDPALLADLLPDLIANFREWEKERRDPNGLFWQIDDRDGMEVSIGGSGYRATINSYMYGDAVAIAKIAALAGKSDVAKQFVAEAARIRKLAIDNLWDAEAEFFKVRPRGEGKPLADVRELHGYVPWYFHLPGPEHSAAWKQLVAPQGFHAPFGPLTAERRHPRFRYKHGHDCQWNGPSWPFATTQTLVALANLLNDYTQDALAKKDYFAVLRSYARSQYKDGKPWIAENLDGDTGQWIVDKPRSIYYNHSGYCDLVITGLVGLRPRADDVVEVNPLVPDGTWDYFCLDRVKYHGQLLTILYDRTGERYGKGKGLRIFADGKPLAAADALERLTARLAP
ncbi:MAG: hypothetical protein ISS72_02235 [Candidatus Brocadiae bacterium]|nr:hypothetical protein [Candidatus Brocadiia bacterium]